MLTTYGDNGCLQSVVDNVVLQGLGPWIDWAIDDQYLNFGAWRTPEAKISSSELKP